ncbi:titin-like isoform X12 [Mytilus californianus]|uniref:titin-like isoform X12 n=1 Tax=Mytilus californianus TaxID=6549 RepID=UPI0022474DB5|nr:titin-like isoform X12 [Mytilus californianus]
MDSTVSGFAPRASRYFIIISMFIIQAAAQIPPGAPSITGPQVIIKDDQVTLTCTVIGGSPTPTVKWLRDDTVIDDSSTTSGNQVVNTYSFTASSREHLEVFECQSENGVLQNPLSRTKFVEVYRPPITPVLVGPTDIQPGTLTTWTCTSEGGYPLQTMAMRIGNSVFSTELTTNSALVSESYTVTGTLSWAPTTANNGQTLFCDVYHPETLGQNNPQTVSKLLTVKSPLAVNAPRTLYEPTTGQTITLTCQVTSGTATSITWYKDNQLLNLAANSRLSGASPGAPSMTISNVQTSDTGNYICSATDGSATRNTSTITVSPRATPTQPTLVGPTSMTAGSTGTWTCTSIGGFPLQTMSMRINNVVVNSNELSINSQYNSNLRTYTVVGTLNKALNMGNNGQTLFCDVTHPQTLQSPQTVSLPLTVRSPLAVNAPRTLYDPTTGQTIELTCRVTSGTATGISWYKNNQLVVLAFNNRYSGGSAQSPSLTISNVQLSDAGNYICSATDGSVTRNTSTITVSPKAPLAVNAPKTLYDPSTGQTAELTCEVTSGTATGISWYKNNQPVVISFNNQYSGGSVQTPSLTISNVQLSDAGNYICSATDGSVTRNASTITVSPKATPTQPTLTGSTSLISGTTGTWTCTSIGGFPLQTMSMRINNVNVGSNELSINSQYNSNTRSYTVVGTLNKALNMGHNGQTIYCDVSHPQTLNSPQTVSLPLTVRSPLAVNAPQNLYEPTTGQTVILQCRVTAGTATGITWYKNGQMVIKASDFRLSGAVPSSPSLTISNVRLSDTGNYICSATDGSVTRNTSTITVTAKATPSQPTLTGPTALTSGTPGTWTCTSIGAFPAQSMSMRIGNQVFSAELSVNTQFDSNARSYTAVGTLNWSPTMINNGQTIFCDVTHPDTLNGPQTVSLPLTVRSPLAVNAPTTFYNPMEDESVTLTCIVTSGTATGIKWYKNTAQINIAANPRISGSMANSPSITITDIVLADGGSYVCEATDGFATVSTNTITVTVREKPWLEYDIITYVLDGYNKLVRPVDPVNNLTHSLIPQQIFEFDGKKLVLQSQQCMNWNDPRLTWPKGQPRISLPSSEIWIPDIVLLGHKYEPDFHTKVIVMKNGDVTYCPQGPLISTDCQEKSGEVYECTFKFLSWSYDKVMLDKYFPGFASRPSIDMSIYYEHDDYEIVSRCAVRREMTYPCRDGTYPELTYSFVLRRRRSFCRNLNQSPTCN